MYIPLYVRLIYSLFTGIFSDVNMLALMYAAEMCYWIEMVSGSIPPTSPANGLDHRVIGKTVSEQYLHLAKGPLSHANWNTAQAILIYDHFQR